LGYHRFDNPAIVPLLNTLYTQEWNQFHNFFCPSVKLIEKQLVAGKTIKRYDIPKTPYQRILEAAVPKTVKRRLQQQFKTLNPFSLRKKMEQKLNMIFLRQFPQK